VEERVKLIRQGSWINYPRATQVLTKLDDLMHQPRTHRMLNMLLVGASGNGKTTLI
jgi:stage III sporulation protein SpoIIIAA